MLNGWNKIQDAPPRGVDRRQVLKGGLVVGAGLVIGFRLPRRAAAFAGMDASAEGQLVANAFLRIAPDDTVTILSKHIEFGQGSYTGLATILAEELDADWSKVRVESAPADITQYANLFFGAQGTGGSTAMANSWEQMRRAGATGRALLVAAAAEIWEVTASEIEVKEGVVSHAGSNRSARFGELVERAAALSQTALPAPEEVPLKDPKNFTLIGREGLPRVDVRAKSRGEAIYTADIALPGMLTAVVERPPRFGGKVASVDAEAAKVVPGVVAVVVIPQGVAVLANGFWAAKKGRDALSGKIQWDESGAETRSSSEIQSEYRTLLDKAGLVARLDGDPEGALQGAAAVLSVDYHFPYLAHAPMEPLDCVVHWTGDACDVWAGSQLQTVDQAVIAGTLGLDPTQVRLRTELGGGSFGRRATPNGDVAGEAAAIAKAAAETEAKGKPIKLVWTREDDIRGGRYRPLTVHRLEAGIDHSGKIVAWTHRVVSQSIMKGTPFEGLIQDGIDETSVEGARSLPYAIPNLRVDLHTTEVGVPILWWRSVGHTHNAFVTEHFLDEVTRLAGEFGDDARLDPVEMRRGLLRDHPRHLAVFELAVEKAGWGTKSLPPGRARGVAVHESFGSFAAQVVEVELGDNDMPIVKRVVCAIDCGMPINPDVIRSQMESGIGYGLGAALHSEITLEGGRVKESNFHNYRSLRMHEMPDVEVHIVPSTENPTGVGEPGLPPLAPAVANAMLALTGRPVHSLPFRNLAGS